MRIFEAMKHFGKQVLLKNCNFFLYKNCVAGRFVLLCSSSSCSRLERKMRGREDAEKERERRISWLERRKKRDYECLIRVFLCLFLSLSFLLCIKRTLIKDWGLCRLGIKRKFRVVVRHETRGRKRWPSFHGLAVHRCCKPPAKIRISHSQLFRTSTATEKGYREKKIFAHNHISLLSFLLERNERRKSRWKKGVFFAWHQEINGN